MKALLVSVYEPTEDGKGWRLCGAHTAVVGMRTCSGGRITKLGRTRITVRRTGTDALWRGDGHVPVPLVEAVKYGFVRPDKLPLEPEAAPEVASMSETRR